MRAFVQIKCARVCVCMFVAFEDLWDDVTVCVRGSMANGCASLRHSLPCASHVRPTGSRLAVRQCRGTGTCRVHGSCSRWYDCPQALPKLVPPPHLEACSEVVGSVYARVSCAGGCVLVRDCFSRRILLELMPHGPKARVVALAFDPSGSLLATSAEEGQTIHVYVALPVLVCILYCVCVCVCFVCVHACMRASVSMSVCGCVCVCERARAFACPLPPVAML